MPKKKASKPQRAKAKKARKAAPKRAPKKKKLFVSANVMAPALRFSGPQCDG